MCCIFLFILLLSVKLESLEREFFAEEYCWQHTHAQPSLCFIQEYLNLIPSTQYQCLNISCSKCQNTWIEFALHEDEDGESEELIWNCNCKLKLLEKNFNKYLSCWLPSWSRCKQKSIYPGYISKNHIKYFSFFQEYLTYISENPACECFWPEISSKAEKINDLCYQLFKNLFVTTELRVLIDNKDEQQNFFITSPENFFNLHGVTVCFICHSFFYSDYEWICRDIEYYCSKHFDSRSFSIIKFKLEEIKEIIAFLFLEIYQECLKKHHNKRIEQEICLVKSFLNLTIDEKIISLNNCNLMVNQPESSTTLKQLSERSIQKLSLIQPKSTSTLCLSNKNKKDINFKEVYAENGFPVLPSRPDNWKESDVLLAHGTFYNSLLLYSDAIQVLTQAILKNPLNKDAYIERGMAYFETNQLDLAIKDIYSAKELTNVPPFKTGYELGNFYTSFDSQKVEFTNGLLQGTVEGAKLSALEFVPSIFGCCRGILNGLWAFVCSPIEVSRDMVNATYSMGEFISNSSTEDYFEHVVPELRELSQTWNKLDDYSRGRKIGFIIGKYSIDIFAPVGVLKGSVKLRSLKRANTVCTLENCILSETKQTKILEESARRASIRTTFAETVKTKTILVKNSNAQYHIMQPKHAWDKLIKLSGNVEEDFKKVMELLETNKVFDKSFLKGEPQKFPKWAPKVSKAEHEIVINSFKVHVELETYLETGEIFLQNAWVVTK